MFEGLGYITKKSNIAKMDKKAPVLFISGNDDPVGDMGKGVRKACARFKESGIRDVQMKLYPKLRHEILNEKENKIIYKDVLLWLNAHLKDTKSV